MPSGALPTVRSLAELADLVGGRRDLFVRWSRGPRSDGQGSTDDITGAPLPGLCAVPLALEPWWGDRPLDAWVGRRLRDYEHLAEIPAPGTRPWVLEGEEVGRGPDNVPLVACLRPLAWVGEEALTEADVLVNGGRRQRRASLERQPARICARLAPEPTSAALARTRLRRLLDDHGVGPDAAGGALLLVSELVTNGILHAGTEIEVEATLAGGRLRVEVADADPNVPVRRNPAPTATSGRGLRLVERVADRWGVERHDGGKAVWFELAVHDVGSKGPASPDAEGAS